MRRALHIASFALTALLALTSGGCKFDAPGSCSASTDCIGGVPCIDGVCAHCRSGADCRSWESCSAVRTCAPLAGRCNSDSDCPAWDLCDGTHSCAHRPGRCPWTQACAAWEGCDPNHLCTLGQGRCYTGADCAPWASCDLTNSCAANTSSGADVLLWGTLQEASCDRDAIAPVSAPTQYVVGSACNSIGDGARLAPTGQVVYWSDANQSVALQVRDGLGWNADTGTWEYPSNPEGNDLVLSGPAACPTTKTFTVQAGTGLVMHGCSNGGAYDYYASGVAVTGLAASTVYSWNANDHKLAKSSGGTRAVVDPAGAWTTIVGFGGNDDVRIARSTLTGFRVATWDGVAVAWRRWTVGQDGVAALEGTYETALTGHTIDAPEVMDASGNLYAQGYLTAASFVDEVIRLPLKPATPTVVYTEATQPAGANGFASSAFNPYVLIHGSNLVTSP